MEPIILASTSPRRQEILKSLGIPFSVFAPPYKEDHVVDNCPEKTTEFHAIKKIESVIRSQINVSAPWILGADTLISLNNQMYGKPKSREEAKLMLSLLSNNTHKVVTSISLFDQSKNYYSSKTNTSFITFMDLEEDLIEEYLDTGEWHGVAGSYRVQGLASCFITNIQGSYSGIMGLPIHELYVILREHNYKFHF